MNADVNAIQLDMQWSNYLLQIDVFK